MALAISVASQPCALARLARRAVVYRWGSKTPRSALAGGSAPCAGAHSPARSSRAHDPFHPGCHLLLPQKECPHTVTSPLPRGEVIADDNDPRGGVDDVGCLLLPRLAVLVLQ